MHPADPALFRELEALEAAGLRRRLEPADGPRGLVDFASNDYLGLARDGRVIEAGAAALREEGAGGRASRLLGGGGPAHARVERAAAEWLGAEAALLFPSGWMANAGLVGALARRGDVVLADALIHASSVDAARLSRARVLVHGHLDLDELEGHLRRARGARRRLVLTEGVFSMDGDRAPLAALHELCARHDAWLVVDEAHSAGLLGPEGRGAWAAAGLAPDAPALVARLATGGKALGVGGALVAGSRALVELLANRARSFVFTTAPSPAVAGALAAAIERCRAMDDERTRALERAGELARKLGLPPPGAAIVPWVLGAPEAALAAADAARAAGFDARAVRPPSVPAGSSRLRLVAHAFNSAAEVDDLARTLTSAPPEARPAIERARTAARVASASTLVVVGTDTGVGKTVVSALLLRGALRRGAAAYWKPVQTGTEDDTAEVRRLSGAPAHACLRPAATFALPASPHQAAEAEGRSLDAKRVASSFEALGRMLDDAHLVVELAGGLLVPYALDATQADWLERARAACVVVARSGLGTLNHTLLTLEALRARHLEPRALFLVGEPHAANRATLEAMASVPRVLEVPRFEPLGPAALDAWLDAHDLDDVLGPPARRAGAPSGGPGARGVP